MRVLGMPEFSAILRSQGAGNSLPCWPRAINYGKLDGLKGVEERAPCA